MRVAARDTNAHIDNRYRRQSAYSVDDFWEELKLRWALLSFQLISLASLTF